MSSNKLKKSSTPTPRHAVKKILGYTVATSTTDTKTLNAMLESDVQTGGGANTRSLATK
jgi:hypothetical protein